MKNQYKRTKVTAPKSDMDLMKLIVKFDTDEKCRIALEKLRWPEGVRCIRCGSGKNSRNYKRNLVFLTPCGYQFSFNAGTIFYYSHSPLCKLFLPTFLLY